MAPEGINRFDQSRYADDEPVHVFRSDRYGTDEDGLWVPERIWYRCHHLGRAYELHLLPLLDGSTDPVFLNPVQVDQLLDELRFVANHAEDPLIEALVRSLIQLAEQPSQGASKEMLGFSFP